MVDYPPVYSTKKEVTVVVKDKHTKSDIKTMFY